MFFAIWLLVPAFLVAPPNPVAEPRFERLTNGLRVIVVEDPAAKSVSAQLWIRAGWTADPFDKPGLCDVVRRSLSSRAPVDAQLRAAGAWIDSATLADACYFHLIAPSQNLERLLDALLARTQLDATADVESRLLATPGNCRSTPIAFASPVVLRALFPNGPYVPRASANPPRFSAADATEFWKTWFAPEAMTLLIIGDVQTPTALEAARSRFSALGWRESRRRPSQDLPDGGVETIRDSGLNDTVTITWLTPAVGDYLNGALDVLMQRLLNSVDGPLARELVAAGFVVDNWRREEWRDAGALTLRLKPISAQSGGDESDADRAAKIIQTALDDAVDHPPQPEALRRARALARLQRLQALSATADRWRRWGELEVIGGDLLLNRFDVPQVEHVAVGDLQQAAMFLREARRVIAIDANDGVSTQKAIVAAQGSIERVSGIEGLRILSALGAAPVIDLQVTPSVQTRRGANRISIEYSPMSSPLITARLVRADVQDASKTASSRTTTASMRDFCTYRSVQLDALANGWRIEAPPDSFLQAIESLARHGELRADDRLLIVGDMSEEDLTWLANDLSIKPMDNSAPSRNAAMVEDDDHARSCKPMREIRGVSIKTAIDLWATEALCWLIGPPAGWGRELDAAHEFRWTCELTLDGKISVYARPTANEADESAALTRLLQSLQALNDDDLRLSLEYARRTRWQNVLAPDALLESSFKALEKEPTEAEALAALRQRVQSITK